MKRLSVPLSVIGLALIVVAALYFFAPASLLPRFFPHYDPSLARLQYKQGVAPLILGVALLAYSGLQRAKR